MVYPMGGTVDGRRGDHVLLAPPFIATRRGHRRDRRAADGGARGGDGVSGFASIAVAPNGARRGSLAEDNAEAAPRIAEIALLFGRRPATAEETRSFLTPLRCVSLPSAGAPFVGRLNLLPLLRRFGGFVANAATRQQHLEQEADQRADRREQRQAEGDEQRNTGVLAQPSTNRNSAANDVSTPPSVARITAASRTWVRLRERRAASRAAHARDIGGFELFGRDRPDRPRGRGGSQAR